MNFGYIMWQTLHTFRMQGFRAFWIWILEAHRGAYGYYGLFSQVFSEAEFESAWLEA
jgi:hypothetical protein